MEVAAAFEEYEEEQKSISSSKSSSFANFSGNGTTTEGEEEGDGWIWDDATWILCSSFIIFTMQTGIRCSKKVFPWETLLFRRLWHARIRLRLFEERGQHHDEERGGRRAGIMFFDKSSFPPISPLLSFYYCEAFPVLKL